MSIAVSRGAGFLGRTPAVERVLAPNFTLQRTGARAAHSGRSARTLGDGETWLRGKHGSTFFRCGPCR
jgi:hypothetical protein